jgi:hypothetical protein
MCVAQKSVNFKAVTSNNALNSPHDVYSADLNNDGLTDIIQIGSGFGLEPTGGADKFAVSIAEGNGRFKAPVYYNFPAAVPFNGNPARARAALALADFNGDGNIDLVAAVPLTLTLVVYLGNGDGTLQAPKTYPLNLPGEEFLWARLLAADFNHDGKIDLVFTAGTGNFHAFYALPGNGDGTFAAVQQIYLFPPPGHFFLMNEIVAGDFDGDGNADIAFLGYHLTANNQVLDNVSVHALYGDGHFGFSHVPVYSIPPAFAPNVLSLGAGDLDGDGRTDLFFASGEGILRVFYGREDRAFDQHSLPSPAFVHGWPLEFLTPDLHVADFNDDGRMDIGWLATDESSDPGFVFFLGTGTRGKFTMQKWPINSRANPVMGIFNRDDKPDLALVQDNPGKPVISTMLNSKANGIWSNCPYPLNGRGISLCSPTSSSDGSISSPVHFNAAAHSFGQLRDMELWVDGGLLSTQHRVWENNGFIALTAGLALGDHTGKILATDIDGAQQQLDFGFTVGAPDCAAPSAAGVNICSPVSGSAASGSEVLVQAAATVTGTLARMEVWLGDNKVHTETTSNHLSASIALAHGTHTLRVTATNTDGASWHQTATITVP